MKKYATVEGKAEVLSPKAHKEAEKTLHKQGKTSAENLTDEERETFVAELHQAE